MIAKNPDLVRRFVATIVEAMQYSFDHPDEACTVVRKYAPSVEQDVCLKELAQVKNVAVTDETKAKGLGFASSQGVERTISVMREYMNLKGAVAPDDVYTTTFLPKR
jgi:NitT/TauT family transport system substrate-binding protein